VPDLASTLRILQPAPNVIAFYDGRVPGARACSDKPNWLDDGAYELGVCTYTIVSRSEALVYDTHISLAHARRCRATLVAQGVERFTVVLSHWHRDHIAGNAVFADCEIVAHALTARMMAERRHEIETGFPPIRPVIGPTRTYETNSQIEIGDLRVELRHADVHSCDGTLLLLAGAGLLFAGDALEDPITYVAEPDRLPIHLTNLHRMATWPVRRILPNHGDPDVIASGGYGPGLIGATIRYVEKLLQCRSEPELARTPLDNWIGDDLAKGHIRAHPPYARVRHGNVERLTAFWSRKDTP
jgi:glyoxylase-like metal-dependent hydrolase (beta-lactamase superfamily II)